MNVPVAGVPEDDHREILGLRGLPKETDVLAQAGKRDTPVLDDLHGAPVVGEAREDGTRRMTQGP